MIDLIFKPIIPLFIMIIFTIILSVIIILNRKHMINRFIILGLLLIISQRPMLRNRVDLTYSLNIDVLFVIDNTASMNAIDANGNTRLNMVKEHCNRIVSNLEGANFGVITFSNYSQIRMPYTNNINDIFEVIDGINVMDPVYANGSSLDLPYDDIKLLLDSSKSKKEHFRVVFYFSDGELTSDKTQVNFEKFKKLVTSIQYGSVIGYGTKEGGKIKIDSTIGKDIVLDKDGFLIDKTKTPHQAAISKIDENNLKNLASCMGINYIHMPNNLMINSMSDEIIGKAEKNRDNTDYSDKDLYYYFSMALLVSLFWELLYYRRNEQ